MTKFFGVKNTAAQSQDYEFGDHDEIDDDKSTVEKETIRSITNFAFKKQDTKSTHIPTNTSDETTEVKIMITQVK